MAIKFRTPSLRTRESLPDVEPAVTRQARTSCRVSFLTFVSGFPDGRGGAFVASGGTLAKVTLDTGVREIPTKTLQSIFRQAGWDW